MVFSSLGLPKNQTRLSNQTTTEGILESLVAVALPFFKECYLFLLTGSGM